MVKRKLSIVLVVLYTLLYTAAHIGAAVVLFSSVKFWLFLVMLLVPFIGDIAAIVCLFSIHCYWPFILYGVSMMLYIAGQMMAKQIDEKQKQRFCKYCGGAIDYITKKCKECNKQYFHVSTKFLKKTGIVLVFALMLGFNIYQYVLYKETNQMCIRDRICAGVRAAISLCRRLHVRARRAWHSISGAVCKSSIILSISAFVGTGIVLSSLAFSVGGSTGRRLAFITAEIKLAWLCCDFAE